METTRQTAPSTADAQIAALLDRAQEASSIFDRLMGMPVHDAYAGASDWDRAVARRLELRLSRSLRDMLEGEPARRSA